MAEEEGVSGSRVSILTAAGVSLAILFYVCLPAHGRLCKLRRELADTFAQAAETAGEVENLRSEKRALEQDPLYLEKVIRTDLRMVRPGEVTDRGQ